MSESRRPAPEADSDTTAASTGIEKIRAGQAPSDGKWVVIDGVVYDVTEWINRHPGGRQVIAHYVGQDATDAFNTFHTDLSLVRAPLSKLPVIGRARRHVDSAAADETLVTDFRELRSTAEKMGLFRPSVCFYTLSLCSLGVFEALAFLMLYKYGAGWVPWTASVFFYTLLQGQASWCQHDFGHLSVFRNTRLNRLVHTFIMNFVKGASASWWRHLHNQHHAKPNVIRKDPDVRMEDVFVFGRTMARMIAIKKKNSLPYNWQHIYFITFTSPLLFPTFFQVMVFRHAICRRQWLELFMMILYYVRLFALFGPLLGVCGVIRYYFLIRCLESQWFVWVSQSNHIPMEINDDLNRPWFSSQVLATCNVEKSFFNDWFTGHLNQQIEHHLFPTMPRHNLYKITPLVRSICSKHGIPYIDKSITRAFGDIIRSLKKSGEMWQSYYNIYHNVNRQINGNGPAM